MIEMGLGRYPYEPETFQNVFAQLTAIVHGDPPELPEDRFSETARDFVSKCLHKIPGQRATYAQLLVSFFFQILCPILVSICVLLPYLDRIHLAACSLLILGIPPYGTTPLTISHFYYYFRNTHIWSRNKKSTWSAGLSVPWRQRTSNKLKLSRHATSRSRSNNNRGSNLNPLSSRFPKIRLLGPRSFILFPRTLCLSSLHA